MSEETGLAVLRRRVLVSTTIGNALEWFDFVVFGLFAAVIGKLFFAASGAANAFLAAFGVFGVAFLVRPLGGVVFGLVADRIGRKTALVWMIGLMASGTAMIAVLPTYAAIGIAAPALLVLARTIQGFSAGGEFGGASALLIEFAPPGRRGYFGAFQMMAQALAYALGAGLAILLSLALTPGAFESWGWRVPFALGLLIGPAGVYLRRACVESPDFVAYRRAQSPPARPLRDLFSTRGREIACSFGVIAAGAAMNYVGVIFVPAFAVARLGLPVLDIVGRRAVIAPAFLLFAALFWLFMHRLAAAPSVTNLWMLQAVGVLFAAFAGPIPALMTEIFPIGLRATGASLAFNIAGALFGGLAPAINGALVEMTGNLAAPAYYVAFVALPGLIGLAGLDRERPG